MTIFNYFSQFMATATYILMCHLILSKHISRKINALLYAYLILVCIFLAPVLGQFGIPVFFIGSDIILLFNKRDRVLNLLLFQIIWAWSVLTDYMLTIPLRLILGYDFSAIDNSLPLTLLFSILHALLCILPCLFIGNRLHRKLVTDQNVIPPQIQLLLFLEVTICSCIFLINIIFGSLLHYPSDILFFNGILIFLMLYNTLQANKKLELQAREQENLTHYMAQLENHYQDIRRFKHDYLNILSTITGYIQENDMDKLRNYFDSSIVTSSSILVNQDDTLARLSLIKVTEIKGLLYTKMVQAMNRQLDVSFELTQEITELSTDLLTLSRVLGIFLDNAIEAASETEQKRFHIAIVCKVHSVIFHIENSTKPLLFPLEELFKPSISSKEAHSGLGLPTANMLIANAPELTSNTICENGLFKQILVVSNFKKNYHNIS
jgi:two-component system sensor histidine kinase AgrC